MNMMKLLAVGGVLVALAGCEKEVEIRSAEFYESNEAITKEVLAECDSGKKMSVSENENCKNAKEGWGQIRAKAAIKGDLHLKLPEGELERLLEESEKELQRQMDEAFKK